MTIFFLLKLFPTYQYALTLVSIFRNYHAIICGLRPKEEIKRHKKWLKILAEFYLATDQYLSTLETAQYAGNGYVNVFTQIFSIRSRSHKIMEKRFSSKFFLVQTGFKHGKKHDLGRNAMFLQISYYLQSIFLYLNLLQVKNLQHTNNLCCEINYQTVLKKLRFFFTF